MSKGKKRNCGLTIIVAAIFGIVLSNCSGFEPPRAAEAHKGFLDLSEPGFANSKTFSLNGEWEFYFGRFISPGDNDQFNTGNLTSYIRIPDSWNNIKSNGRNLPSGGYATYRLLVKLPDGMKNAGIRIPTVNTAYKLYIDKALLADVGGLSRTREDSGPKYAPQVILFQPRSNELELVFHVSNFQHQRAGINKIIIMGDADSILKMRETDRAKEMFFTGCIFIIIIYNLWIFCWRRKERAMLFFSIFGFFMLIRIFSQGENIFFEWFPYFDWVWHYRIELLSTFVLPPVFCFFIYHLYPDESIKPVCYASAIVGIVATATLFIVPSLAFASIFNVYQFVIILNAFYAFSVLARAALGKKTGALMLLIGFAFFTYSIINDILFAQLVIRGGFIVPLGFFILSLFEFGIYIHFIRAKDLLIRSENKIMALLSALPDPMVYFNAEGRVLDYKTTEDNELFVDTDGFRGSVFFDAIPGDLAGRLKSLVSDRTVKKNPDVFEYRLEKFDHVKYFEIRLMRGEERTYLAVIQDVTSGKVTEQKLFQADKLAAIGTLVAGVAHEINNPNNSILLMVDNFGDELRAFWEELENNDDAGVSPVAGKTLNDFTHECDDFLTRLKRNSLRIKQIVKDLKDFSSENNEDVKEHIDLHSVIDCAIQLLHNKIKNSTNYFSVVRGELPVIYANFQRLEQIFINLFQNACDSLPDKEKRITTTTGYDSVSGMIKIEIQDEGIGMSAEIQKKIFDPFFTTKKKSGGLGLGLSITYKIIESYDGTLEFNSMPGKGTIAIMKLPVKYR